MVYEPLISSRVFLPARAASVFHVRAKRFEMNWRFLPNCSILSGDAAESVPPRMTAIAAYQCEAE